MLISKILKKNISKQTLSKWSQQVQHHEHGKHFVAEFGNGGGVGGSTDANVGSITHSTILGLPLTETILDLIAALGVCPVLDSQFVDDLQSIDRLNDSATGDLLLVLVEVLKAMGEGSSSRIPEVVDLLSIPHAIDASIPLEETLRDLGGSPFLETLAASLGPTLNSENFVETEDFPDGVEVVDFEGIWEIIGAAFRSDEDGRSPLSTTLPLLEAVVAHPDTWSGLYALGDLLAGTPAPPVKKRAFTRTVHLRAKARGAISAPAFACIDSSNQAI